MDIFQIIIVVMLGILLFILIRTQSRLNEVSKQIPNQCSPRLLLRAASFNSDRCGGALSTCYIFVTFRRINP